MRKQDVLEYLEDAYSFLMDPAIGRAIDEIKHLRQQNAELVEAYDRLKAVYDDLYRLTPTQHFITKEVWDAMVKTTSSAIAKATGGE